MTRTLPDEHCAAGSYVSPPLLHSGPARNDLRPFTRTSFSIITMNRLLPFLLSSAIGLLRCRVICFGLLCVPLPVRGQAAANLTGVILDASGAAVPAARITLTDTSRTGSRNTASDRFGAYQFVQLPPGSYSVRVEKEGFKILVREDLRLNVAVTTTLNLPLEIGSVSEEVSVAAATPDRKSVV